MLNRIINIASLFILSMQITIASEQITYSPATYSPAKVIYDVSNPESTVLNHILDRASLLQNIYSNNPFEASIIIVVHEGAIPLFAKSSQSAQQELMRRANSLTMGEIIEFRLCRASAKMQGFEQQDFPDFVKIVPMADAEIVKLQNEGYAYLR